MRRGWLAGLLLVGMVCLGMWHVFAMDALTGDLGRTLERAEELAEAGDWTGAAGLTRQASERWDGNHFYLHVTLDHAVADEIAVSFAETLEFLEIRESGEYSAANARLMEQLELLREMERPTLENLF